MSDLEKRSNRIKEVSDPLPGSVPYTNVRKIHVPERCNGLSLIRFLEELKTHLSTPDWLAVIAAGNLRQEDREFSPQMVVRAGECFVNLIPDTVEPDVDSDIRVIYEDPSLFIVDKPAPLPVHPSGRFNKNTVIFILNLAFPEFDLRPVHRLDANTTGILIFAKTKEAAKMMAQQFENHKVEKTYLVRVQGHPCHDTFHCDLPIHKSPHESGVRIVDDKGLESMTRFQVLSRFPDGTSLLEAQPTSGRTNQIRLHLKEQGHPVLGDSVYADSRDLTTGFCQQQKLFLHAWMIRFVHPHSERELLLSTEKPAWAIS
ncbi:MAG: RluA family pseudouridine synthase [Pseudomonadota bacterium]